MQLTRNTLSENIRAPELPGRPKIWVNERREAK
jgi:hypothetical protein